MSPERPNFKLTLEKTDEISDIDVKAFVNCYREANKPQTISYLKHRPSQTKEDKNSISSASTQTNADKQKQEALKKLEELGVVVFMPENIKDKNLDWD